MNLRTTFESLKQSLSRPAPAFAEARLRERALAPYETPAAVVLSLRPDSPLSVAERDALVAALLAEHQRARADVWQAMLLVAFAPMLFRLRAKLGSRGDEDLDQALLLAFLESAATVRPGTYAPVVLRWSTEAKVFADRRRAQRAPRMAAFEENRLSHGGVVHAVGTASVEAEELVRLVLAKGGRDLYDAVLATDVHGEALTAYVARVHAARPAAERASLYTRLKRARAEVLEEARTRFAGPQSTSQAA